MQKIRVLGASIAIGGIALLTGCVGVPGDPYYSGGYSSGGYSEPYYSDPSPVVVAPAPVYIQGGGYYDGGRYYDRRPYYGGRPGYPYPAVRPGYPAVRPAYPAGRPPGGWNGVRPGVAQGGVPGVTPSRPQQMPQGRARLWTSPDSNSPNAVAH